MDVINKKGGDKSSFEQLLKDINNRIKELEDQQDVLLKKMVKKNN